MAIVAIGDGVVGVLFPVRHRSRLAEQGPEPWRRAMRVFTEHPGLTRALGVVEAARRHRLGGPPVIESPVIGVPARSPTAGG